MELSSYLHSGYHKPLLREWQGTRTLKKSTFMYPMFVTDEEDAEVELASLPGQKRWGINKLVPYIRNLVSKGLTSIILFGVPLKIEKTAVGSHADDEAGPVIQAIKVLRKEFPDLIIAADVCLCEYTSHGHCGILNEDGTINNTKSIERLANVALQYALAGAHIVAPSDMMDGRIGAIKRKLVEKDVASRVTLMSYSAKFATCLYGPFRDAAGSAPSFGDRKCYQLPSKAKGLARRAIKRDISEGADIIMVKPASLYLDIISEAAQIAQDLPIATYQVSGEFSMLHAAAKAGVFDLQAAATESCESFLRAGATIILSYFTPDFLDWLRD